MIAFRVEGLEFGVRVSGLGFWGLGFWVECLGFDFFPFFRGWGVVSSVWGSGFGV